MPATRTITVAGRTFVLTTHRWPEGDYTAHFAEVTDAEHTRTGIGPVGAATAEAALSNLAADFERWGALQAERAAKASGAA